MSEQRGSATLLAVAFLGVVVLVGAALGVVAAMVHGVRVAQSTADLAAVAAAERQQRGLEGCAAAAAVARVNGAVVESCAVEGAEVRVQVSVEGPRWLGQSHDLTGEARAGPA